jgi:hypothetical protein
VFYEFNGSERELYDNEKIPTDVATHGNHKSYHIEFTVRKSILGTLVIEDWNIVQKI